MHAALLMGRRPVDPHYKADALLGIEKLTGAWVQAMSIPAAFSEHTKFVIQHD